MAKINKVLLCINALRADDDPDIINRTVDSFINHSNSETYALDVAYMSNDDQLVTTSVNKIWSIAPPPRTSQSSEMYFYQCLELFRCEKNIVEDLRIYDCCVYIDSTSITNIPHLPLEPIESVLYVGGVEFTYLAELELPTKQQISYDVWYCSSNVFNLMGLGYRFEVYTRECLTDDSHRGHRFYSLANTMNVSIRSLTEPRTMYGE